MKIRVILSLSTVAVMVMLLSCSSGQRNSMVKQDTYFTFKVQGMSDLKYPDNPDIGYRSKKNDSDFFDSGKLIPEGKNNYTLIFYSSAKYGDTIWFKNIDLSQLMPAVPNYLKSSKYMSDIAVVNQEWNRDQVQFNSTEFRTTDPAFIRVDIASNCLNAYAWEIILYTKEDGKVLPAYHGWFSFPHDSYQELFQQKNNIPFSVYQKELENWIEPQNNMVDTNLLRKVVGEVPLKYADESNEMYPLKGERKRKRKDIVSPKVFDSMKDLQTDSTKFATFDFPGFYNRSNPRPTELGRFYKLKSVKVYKTLNQSNRDTSYELNMEFIDKQGKRQTHFIIGGLKFALFPALSDSDVNDGWKNSMGFGNHTFYETYAQNLAWHNESNPYYAYFTDEQGRWLDSHKIGVDGPLFYFDRNNKQTLNVWMLSFERQAFVGHYKIMFLE